MTGKFCRRQGYSSMAKKIHLRAHNQRKLAFQKECGNQKQYLVDLSFLEEKPNK
ncbi:MAG: hypothetical protein ACYS32_15065 [Planctomycetota bacterium]|jgi:hypothetical protein